MSNAKDLIDKDNQQDDLVAIGFHKLDDKLVERRAPKIEWGRLYKDFTDAEKIAYLEKLAATMNNAAYLIQNERNELTRLCELKEKQIEKIKAAMDQNMAMLQSEVTAMNSQRQGYHQEVARLNGIIRDKK